MGRLFPAFATLLYCHASFAEHTNVITNFNDVIPEQIDLSQSEGGWILSSDSESGGQVLKSFPTGKSIAYMAETRFVAVNGFVKFDYKLEGTNSFVVKLNGETILAQSTPTNGWLTFETSKVAVGENLLQFFHSPESFPFNNFAYIDNLELYGARLDSDDDGLQDAWELAYGFNPNEASDAMLDADNDGLSLLQEYQERTEYNLADTDSDMLPDGLELEKGTSPKQNDRTLDTDNDGFENYEEVKLGSDHNSADSTPSLKDAEWHVDFNDQVLPSNISISYDGKLALRERLEGGFELSAKSLSKGDRVNISILSASAKSGSLFFDYSHIDPDLGSTNGFVVSIKDDPFGYLERRYQYNEFRQRKKISTGYGVSEAYIWFNSPSLHDVAQSFYLDDVIWVPNDLDSDQDGLPDHIELEYYLDRFDNLDAHFDQDGDLLSNLEEYQLGTSIMLADSDSDGFIDSWELDNGFDPLSYNNGRADTDKDGVSDRDESWFNSDPKDPASLPVNAESVLTRFETPQLPNFVALSERANFKFIKNDETGFYELVSPIIQPSQYAAIEFRGKFSAAYLHAQLQAVEGAQCGTSVSALSSGSGGSSPVSSDRPFGYIIETKPADSYERYTVSCRNETDSPMQFKLLGLMYIDENALNGFETSDMDGDTLPDYWEYLSLINEYGYSNFDVVFSEDNRQSDFDNDGFTNLEEFEFGTAAHLADTDGDLVMDVEDTAPLDSSKGENQAPSVSNFKDEVTYEAIGEFTPIDKMVTFDISDNGAKPPYISIATYDVLEHSNFYDMLGKYKVEWEVRDYAGHVVPLTQIITLVDTTAPQYDADKLVEYDFWLDEEQSNNEVALAELLEQSGVLKDASSDHIAVGLGDNVLKPGTHEYLIEASDGRDNTEFYTIPLTLNIRNPLPEVSFKQESYTVKAGEELTIEAMISTDKETIVSDTYWSDDFIYASPDNGIYFSSGNVGNTVTLKATTTAKSQTAIVEFVVKSNSYETVTKTVIVNVEASSEVSSSEGSSGTSKSGAQSQSSGGGNLFYLNFLLVFFALLRRRLVVHLA
ncbi:hypothetical protein [Pseudoalteromonas luteoviolacea]|uniref:Uncharacterized protein n=1 Tax=Pseudoalteromonas luteoviolacea S4054 TaxID=1129367 RepID=A0A0F6A558_9GAMM|nr:hypothetical protein [Pseudoalteromonas luteoviolacea]AOT11073.1 hypothetical protein S4054249_24885 [Pseudoalteromonas luteoviolacea]AOT15763.1 hypothetical protein S40542_23625 [Pseudoalteromonas luteoviolacea]AOT20894.1 hypothetical protein S4054_24805 [Pseudoalteromonas luteoviolacea]KKE80991.1 hypothetical protein N479_24085 [Pseudoalteromonas luteoviolacea S4054]KZN74548.1 hypothetical protein N481_08990 [Pseudoalteromonas luteoviolacea S4047-1]